MKRKWRTLSFIFPIGGILWIQILHLGGKLSSLEDGSGGDSALIFLEKFLATRNDDPKSWAKQHFQEAGLLLDTKTIQKLPTNEQIQALLGPEPQIVGEDDQCPWFRKRVPNPIDRWVGVAGCFNTGTNLLAELLQKNCILPGVGDIALSSKSRETIITANKQYVRWQVPWGKHTLATESRNHTASTGRNVIKDNGLTVVTVRDPYMWAWSMCHNPYAVKWSHTTHNCPNLRAPVLSYGGHTNLMQFWNVWYQNYYRLFPYPRIMVRVEDLTLRPHRTIQQICNCAGGQMRKDSFQHVLQSAKTSRIRGGHTSTTGMVEAWEKVLKREPNGGISSQDYDIAKDTLDEQLMNIFGYTPPPPISIA
eukprot:scaffold22620_cov131-Cylindrotheca_fusiformis.AAC.8